MKWQDTDQEKILPKNVSDKEYVQNAKYKTHLRLSVEKNNNIKI